MQISMSTVLNLIPIYQTIKTQVLPAKTAYKFNKLFHTLEKEANFYHDELNKLITEYSEKNEDGTPKLLENGTGVQIQKEYIDMVQNKFNELLKLEVEVPEIKFSFEEFDKLQLTIEEFDLFLNFIEE